MIGRLRGLLVERGHDGVCVLDVAGVGYEVVVPLGTLGKLPAPPEPVTLHVHTHVREDALSLFGFASAEDRVMFRALLGIPNVGPKLAMAVLGSLAGAELASVVARGDLARLNKIPGVGKKTAERIVLELRDKVLSGALAEAMGAAGAAPPPAADKTPAGPLSIVTGALVNMGYKPAEAARAVAAIKERSEGKAVEDLLREALVALAG